MYFRVSILKGRKTGIKEFCHCNNVALTNIEVRVREAAAESLVHSSVASSVALWLSAESASTGSCLALSTHKRGTALGYQSE